VAEEIPNDAAAERQFASGRRPSGEVSIGSALPHVFARTNNWRQKGDRMTKTTATIEPETAEHDAFCSATAIAALLFLASQFPHRQFNVAELCVLSGIGRTAMSQIKNARDTPFSLGKCTLQRLDAWLANHPGFKQE
jgi:hypothetical protein